MLFVKALSADDLLKAIDLGSDQRSHGCTANLVRFDYNKGTLHFVTRCAGSKDAWEQDIVLTDWDLLKPSVEEVIEEPEEVPEEELETAPILPEEAPQAQPTAPLVVPPSTPPAPKPNVPTTTLQPGKPLRPLIQQSHLIMAQEILTWEQVKEQVPEVMESDIRLHCGCPSHQFNGPHYILDQLDSAITPENRYPNIRDPDLQHTLCKHLIAVLRRFF